MSRKRPINILSEMPFIKLAHHVACFYEKYYGQDGCFKELNAMNMSGVELPLDVFKNADLAHFSDVSEDLVDDIDVEFGITSLQIFPREFFDGTEKHNDEMSSGILAALSHMGMDGVWTLEEINMYIHGQCPINDLLPGYLKMFDKVKSAWLAIEKENRCPLQNLYPTF